MRTWLSGLKRKEKVKNNCWRKQNGSRPENCGRVNQKARNLFIIFLSKVKHINSVSWGVYKVEFLFS